MIRRWSRIDDFNNFHCSTFFFDIKFNVNRLIKILNYKRYVTGISKFKRHKLSQWKRRGNWLPYVFVIKYWVRDYNFNKKLTRSQFNDAIFLDSCYLHDFNYIKRKNPLNIFNDRNFLLNSFPRQFFFYFFNKFKNKASSFFTTIFKNNNFILAYTLKNEQIDSKNKIITLPSSCEGAFYSVSQVSQITSISQILFFKNLFSLFFSKFILETYITFSCLLKFR